MRTLHAAAGFGILVAAWVILLVAGIIDARFIPWPHEILMKLMSFLEDGLFYRSLANTLFRAFAGFVLAAALGVSAGLLLGHSRRLGAVFIAPVDFLRSVPSTSLVPLFLFLFGIGDASKVAVVVFSCTLVNLINSLYGVRSASEARLMMAAAFGASRWTVLTKIVLPSSLPHVAAGLRTTLSLSLILVVVSEMLVGTGAGIGQMIMDARFTYRISDMYALILALGLVGFALNRGFVMLEGRVLHWAR